MKCSKCGSTQPFDGICYKCWRKENQQYTCEKCKHVKYRMSDDYDHTVECRLGLLPLDVTNPPDKRTCVAKQR